MVTALTIAGSDSSGGAGIQADLKTFCAHDVYGMSVICALTAQNTLGVTDIMNAASTNVAKQLDAVFSDIRPDSVKIGMVSSAPLIAVIAERLAYYQAENIVLDPVMVSTSGCRLLEPEAESALTSLLFPLADIITPNIPEAECLTGLSIKKREEMAAAAEKMAQNFGCAILLKGGHLEDCADDLYVLGDTAVWLEGTRIATQNTHGTGCTLSSAIAAGLAQKKDMLTAVRDAKEYVAGAIAVGLNLGRGNGPLDHMYRQRDPKRRA